jgi:hypothetical protein
MAVIMLVSLCLPIIIAITGNILLIYSIILYYRRTEDQDIWKKIWLGKDLLSKKEYWLNRGGLTLTIIGVLLALGGIVIVYLAGMSTI